MSREVGVVFKASDNLTNALNSMRNSTRNLSKDITDCKRIQEEAFGKRVDIKYDITKARESLKQLTKDVKNNVEGSEDAWKKQQKHIQELEEEYKTLGKVANEAGAEQRKLQEDISRSNNKGSSSGGGSKQAGMLGTLAQAGMTKMIGESLANAGGALTTSLLGERTGNAVKGIAGSAASGAALGSLAGPMGMAIGAGVGAIVGAINAASEELKQKDEYFKNEVKSLYDTVKQQQEETLKGGSQSAASLEVSKIAFGTLLGGDNKADKFLKEIDQFGSVTPFETDDLLTISKTLLAYTYKQKEIIPLMTKVGDAGSALGMKPEDINTVATMLGRMKSTGKTNLEYLNPLLERGIPVFDYLAESMKTTSKEVQEMISDGLIPGAEAAKIISDTMGEKFAGNMEKQSQTFEGLTSTLEDAKTRLDRAMGEGYNEERKKGMENEIAAYTEGIVGDKMQEANRLIGQFKADLENQYQQSIIDATSDAMTSEDYLKAEQEGNGAEMGRILAEARAKAEMEYKNSEGYQLQQQSDLLLVQGLQADLAINGEYLNYGRKMADQFTVGFAGGIAQARSEGKFSVNISSKDTKSAPIDRRGMSHAQYISSRRKGYAIGLDRVPYDNFPAMLHEGERVLTREQADKKGSNPGMPMINIENMTVREENDINKVASEILYLINKSKENYGGNN